MSAVLDFLQALVRTDTTPGNEREGIRRAAEEMRRLDFDDVRVDDHGNLIGRVGAASEPVLVIDGHIDTVPVYSPEQWSQEPLGGRILDGRLYGRGAADMKGGIASFVHAGGQLVRRRPSLHGCVLFVVSIAEETLEGASLARSFDRRQIDWCVIAEPTDLSIATAQRGRARVEVVITGRSAHAANSARGVNAAAQMALLAERVRVMDHPTHGVLGAQDINLIDIHSEPYPSISTIPYRCTARFDVRFLPGESPEALLELFRTLVPDGAAAQVGFAPAEFESYTGERYLAEDLAVAWETPRDSALLAAARTALRAPLTPYGFCTNGSYFAGVRGVPTVGYGPGSADQAHVVDEHVPLGEVESAVGGYRALIETLLAS